MAAASPIGSIEPFAVFLELGGERLGHRYSLRQVQSSDVCASTAIGSSGGELTVHVDVLTAAALSSAFGAAMCSLGA